MPASQSGCGRQTPPHTDTLTVTHKDDPLILSNTCGIPLPSRLIEISPTRAAILQLSHNFPSISGETTFKITLLNIHLRGGKWYKFVYECSYQLYS